jgi:glutamyl/glutaminyl-tRNA synthetase
MILGADGPKLSKRRGAVSVLQYRDEGYLPEAILNYLVRLGCRCEHRIERQFADSSALEAFCVKHSALFWTFFLEWLEVPARR